MESGEGSQDSFDWMGPAWACAGPQDLNWDPRRTSRRHRCNSGGFVHHHIPVIPPHQAPLLAESRFRTGRARGRRRHFLNQWDPFMNPGCQQMDVKTGAVTLGVSQCAFGWRSYRSTPDRVISIALTGKLFYLKKKNNNTRIEYFQVQHSDAASYQTQPRSITAISCNAKAKCINN